MKRIFTSFLFLLTFVSFAVAQESVDFSAGTFDGEYGQKEGSRSRWTSENGLVIVATDANGNEIGSMKYYNNRFQLDIDVDVATPIKYTITAPEGYSLTEMKLKNSTKSHNAHVDYDLRSYSLYNTTSEQAITFVEGENAFYLYGTGGRAIYITSLTITKVGGEDTSIGEVKGENDKAKVIYDLTGRRVDAITAPGIYIVNGKKTLVK